MKIQDVDREAETVFSNYKYVDGILIPFSVETKMDGKTVMQMVLEDVKYNVDLDDSIFEMPEVSAPNDSTEVK